MPTGARGEKRPADVISPPFTRRHQSLYPSDVAGDMRAYRLGQLWVLSGSPT